MSDKAYSVLQLIAGGYALEEIADMLHLTQRGVCYHIDRMTMLFDCSNRAYLINKAKDLELL